MSLNPRLAASVLLFTLFVLAAMCGVASRPPVPVPSLQLPDLSPSAASLLLQAQELEEEAQEFSQALSDLLMDAEYHLSPEPLCDLPAQSLEVTP